MQRIVERRSAREAGLRAGAVLPGYSRSIHNLETVFLDNRVGQNVLGDFLQLFLSLLARPAIQIQHKEFSLSHVSDRGVAKSGESVLDGLSLWIEHGAL